MAKPGQAEGLRRHVRGRAPRAPPPAPAGFPASLTRDKDTLPTEAHLPVPERSQGEAICSVSRAGAEAHRINQNENVVKTKLFYLHPHTGESSGARLLVCCVSSPLRRVWWGGVAPGVAAGNRGRFSC